MTEVCVQGSTVWVQMFRCEFVGIGERGIVRSPNTEVLNQVPREIRGEWDRLTVATLGAMIEAGPKQ